ncbi:MAG: hypothetical protein Q8J78_08365 [Moraxellaceae bacterium]|nr:hypothetical protein [Moraxellaceae bacterium]
MNARERAIEEVKNVNPKATNCTITNVHYDFLDGTLFVVGFESEGNAFHNYVFVDSKSCHISKNEALLISMISKKSKKYDVLEALGGMSGIIGLIITVTIAYLVIRDPSAEVPPILSAALTAILGFYFGSKTQKNS